MIDILIFIGIFITGIVGYLHKSLTKSGAWTAIVVGAAVYVGFGLKGLILLGTFFATSNYWSKYKSSVKQPIEEKLAKGATRDWRQVIANGGAAGLFSIIHYFDHDPIWQIGFAVSLASANSDTWASEIGSLSRKNPIYIRTFKRVEKGTSGAISSLGSAAALAGTFLISIISFWLFDLDSRLTFLVFLFGYIGNVIDTIMGAYYQQMYVCQRCGIETEKRRHCQLPTTRIKGFTLVDNDMVNFLSGFLAAIAAIGMTLVIK
ncbi:hypothetical protein BABA_16662 [Neobacillus bataviensis LMG 21833]|uniref:Integral membrane protein n=1 Tax=Neobacillus bataviensis LMG 21833 TaxID=1117379 RepID=K6DD67_9BACI|nr:DUF92 domain-containing protein [Neobacillus bataviensis]EKN66269.1 hypothetical protein BABA_16662 [Neobacillus bataviensis LMG 21833]